MVTHPTEISLSPQGIFAVRLEGEGGCAIKRVSQTENHWVLASDNPEYPPLAVEEARRPNIVIGRVVWSWTSWIR